MSDTQEHRREDHDLQQADRDEHERVHGVTHDGFSSKKRNVRLQPEDVSTHCDSTLSAHFDVREPRKA
jgi:hypothetical protein